MPCTPSPATTTPSVPAHGTERINIGVKASGLANPNAKWEQSIQTDFGVDLGFLGNRITATLDYYIKDASGMLMEMQVPTYAGDSAPTGNVGTMRNSGIEMDFGFRGALGDFNYGIKANASTVYLKMAGSMLSIRKRSSWKNSMRISIRTS